MLFCSWLIYGCEQLRHLKESMHLMMQLSASEGVSMLSSDNTKEFILENHGALDFIHSTPKILIFFHADEIIPPATAPTKIFQRVKRVQPKNEQTIPVSIRLRDTKDSLFVRLPPALMDMEVNPESGRHSSVIRSAIKYWVERHKHILV
jgi:7tm Odorant receptor